MQAVADCLAARDGGWGLTFSDVVELVFDGDGVEAG